MCRTQAAYFHKQEHNFSVENVVEEDSKLAYLTSVSYLITISDQIQGIKSLL